MPTFWECVLSELPIRLLVLDTDLNIVYANAAYCQLRGLPAEEVIGKNIAQVFPDTILKEAGLAEAMHATLRTGQRVRWSGYRQPTADHTERIIDIRLDRCSSHDPPHLLLTIEDVTDRHRQVYQQRILQQITQAMLGIVELPRLLHAILTGLTAGGAAGLGFNRAILLLIDEEEQMLRAEMAVGPESAEQAGQIWADIAQRHYTLEDFLADYDSLPPPSERPLHNLVQQLVFPMDETDILPMSAIAARQTVHVKPTDSDQRTAQKLCQLMGSEEFVVAPLVVKDKAIGAIIACNAITGQPISEPDVQLLTGLANHAALAIDSAHTYEELRRRVEELDSAYRQLEAAQQEVVRAEKLSTIGQVTAVVAHEIRNPLTTIGGFARAISRHPDNAQRIKRDADIIIEEVQRLEAILQNLLDFTQPAKPDLVLHDVKPLIENIGEIVRQDAEAYDVVVHIDIPAGLPEIYLDENQLHQVILNLTRNSLEAMLDGGELYIGAQRSDDGIEIRITDTGEGIPEEHINQIFDTFFTTKRTGTGLGLTLTQGIVREHGGELHVHSQPGEGSTFVITFPIPTENKQ